MSKTTTKRPWEIFVERVEEDSSWKRVPDHTKRAMIDYLRYHTRPGSFLRSVLTNDLTQSVLRADRQNLDNLHHITRVMFWFFPADAWGSKKQVASWTSVEWRE